MEYEVLDGLNETKYLKYSNYDALTRNVYFPLRTICYKEQQFIYYPDGNFEKNVTYTIEPPTYVDGIPLMSSYGQMMFNSFMNKRYNTAKEVIRIENQPINYDNL